MARADYRWNAVWGYLYFNDLNLYYVHGRWYSPDVGRFIEPNEKGDYMYGGDGPCYEDVVNCAWQHTVDFGVNAFQFLGSAGAQFVWDQSFGLPGVFGASLYNDTNARIAGHVFGRGISEAFNAYLMAQGIADIGTGTGIGGASLICEAATVGLCTLPATIGGTTSLGLILKGGAETAWGGANYAYLQNNPLQFARGTSERNDPTLGYGTNTGDTGRNADILRRNMGVGDTPGRAAHHLVPSTDSYESARRARGILQRLSIDINAANNGVLLPNEVHYGLSRNQRYMDAVLTKLREASTQEDATRILKNIGEQLLRGGFPR